MNNPKVSIIIPVYNGSNYLNEAIDSALRQTYKNIEVIVVNDGSIDNTEEISLSYGNKIRYFSKINGGVSTALNLGIKNMQGEYFSWLSHDDLYVPDKILKNINACKYDPFSIVYSDYDCIDENGKLIDTSCAKITYRSADYGFGLFPIINSFLHGCSLLIHKSQFEKYGLFDEALRTTQDYDLWFRMFRNQRLIYISEPLSLKRFHKNQVVKTSDRIIPEFELYWVKILNSLTKEEKRHLDISCRNFWIKKMLFFEKNASYIKTTALIKNNLDIYVNELQNGLVSIILSFYNNINLVIQSINTVKNQSYKNWELILINNGSSDNIISIEKYCLLDNRIRIINIDHSSDAYAKNTGLDIIDSNSKFIAFLNTGDLWDVNKLEKQIKYILSNNVCIAHTNYYIIDINGELLEEIDISYFKNDVFCSFLNLLFVSSSSVLIEREFWNNRRFKLDLNYSSDICIWLELAWLCNWGCLEETLTSVITENFNGYKKFYDYSIKISEVWKYLLKNPDWENYLNTIGILNSDFLYVFPEPNIKKFVNDKIINDQKISNEYIHKNKILKVINLFKKEGFLKVLKIIVKKIFKKFGIQFKGHNNEKNY